MTQKGNLNEPQNENESALILGVELGQTILIAGHFRVTYFKAGENKLRVRIVGPKFAKHSRNVNTVCPDWVENAKEELLTGLKNF